MTDILHSIHVKADKGSVLNALDNIDGLSKWWTSTTEGNAAVGETIGFRFGEHVTEARVDEVSEARVAWTVERSNPDWDDTKITFDLVEDDGKTLVRFGHREWKEANPFLEHCSMKWATFLLSLRDFVESGKGRPFPDDVQI